MYALAKKTEYLEAKLSKHDRQFIDVNTELKDKFISISGTAGDPNENLLQVVIDKVNEMLRAALHEPFEISRDDIDMVYRSGRRAPHHRYPRAITVIFMRRGLKQDILAIKKSMTWDTNNRVTYADDFVQEVRLHREILKSIASKVQNGDYIIRMAGNRIFINGIPYGQDDMDILPDELKRAIPQMKNVKNGIAFHGKESYLSNFFPCEIRIDDEVYSSVEQYFQSQKCDICNDYDRAEKFGVQMILLKLKQSEMDVQSNQNGWKLEF